MRTLYLDTETTGLDPAEDEVLEIGVLSDEGEVLVDSLVCPERHTSWPDAERIHGITPQDVAGAPTWAELRPRIADLVAGARVVIYNAPFDSGFVGTALDGAAEVLCAMRAFAEVFGEWSDWFDDWKWQRLGVAAEHVGFEWSGDAHRAIHDCAATRAVWHWLNDPEAEARTADQEHQRSLQREADEALMFFERDQAAARWTRARETEAVLFERLALRPPGRHQTERHEALMQAFTGCTRAVWEKWQETPALPVYRQGSEIPGHLVTVQELKSWPVWVRGELAPAALWVSASGRQIAQLYDTREADRLVETRLPHYESFAEVPEGLATKTRFRKARGQDPVKAGVAPAAKVRLRSRGGRVYTDLFPLGRPVASDV